MLRSGRAGNLMNASLNTIRVAHLLFGDGVWGVENYVYNLLASSKSSSVKPVIICTSEGVISQKFLGANAEIDFVPVSGYFDIGSMVALSTFFRKHKIDLVHVHLGLDSFVGTIAAKMVDLPVIMSVHFDKPNYMSYRSPAREIWNTCQIFKNKAIAHFLPITKNVAAELMQREAVAERKTTVVHPGIPVFDVDRSVRSETRCEFAAADDELVVIGVGRLEPEKNFDCLVKAFARIDPDQKITAWIVGDGSQKEELERLVQKLNLQNRVKLLGYRRDVRKLLASADVFVLPSKAEPFGMSAVEAMMSGLPVIGTMGPGLGTIVEDVVTGLLVPPDDDAALGEAIQKLSSDQQMRERFGNAGRTRAMQHFSSDQMAEKIVSIYRAVLSAAPT